MFKSKKEYEEQVAADKPSTKGQRCKTWCKETLKKSSSGYYRTELYLDGHQLHASLAGGILTLLALFAVIGYAIYILYGIFTL